ncbi:MAG: metal ABC transporter permease, partial [Rhizobiaceae bacterium]
VLAALAGAMSAVGGLYGSLAFNTPSGPSIVVAAFAVFLASLAAGAAITAFNNRKEPEHAA